MRNFLAAVYYFPGKKVINDYCLLHMQVLRGLGFKVVPDIYKALLPPYSVKRYLILNWLESRVVNPDGDFNPKGFLRVLSVLIVIYLSGARLVWVKHNYKPHESKGAAYKISSFISTILEKKAWKIVVHSDQLSGDKYNYIPHPLYNENPQKVLAGYSSGQYLFLGRIMPYKGLEELLEIWPDNLRLNIYGKIHNPIYLNSLNSIISRRNLKVVTIFPGFVDEEKLGQILEEHDVMVLPHREETAIVSGSYYLGKSNGMILLARSPYADLGDFNYFDGKSLRQAVKDIKIFSRTNTPMLVFENAVSMYGTKKVGEAWTSLLSE